MYVTSTHNKGLPCRCAGCHLKLKMPSNVSCINALYNEIDWPTLNDRRTYQKSVLTFTIKNSMVPDYQGDLFPRSVGNPQYNLIQKNLRDIDCL